MLLLVVLSPIFVWVWSATALSDHEQEIARIRSSLHDPDAFLKNDGNLIVMGNAPFENANIVFLPEIHDDPKSLMTQLVLIARERLKNKPFLILDESLAAHKKSMWDLFSQKTMEILAAKDQRRNQQEYVPKHFEIALQNMATKMRANEGQLNYLNNVGLWTLNSFTSMATPFYGWDTANKDSLTNRNAKMVETLRGAMKNNDRILVMAGARHIPELEFLTSQKLLCPNSQFNSMDAFFNTLTGRYGQLPDLRNGIGATAPIHNFLRTQKYAIIFNRAFYSELDRIVDEFKTSLGNKACITVQN